MGVREAEFVTGRVLITGLREGEGERGGSSRTEAEGEG